MERRSRPDFPPLRAHRRTSGCDCCMAKKASDGWLAAACAIYHFGGNFPSSYRVPSVNSWQRFFRFAPGPQVLSVVLRHYTSLITCNRLGPCQLPHCYVNIIAYSHLCHLPKSSTDFRLLHAVSVRLEAFPIYRRAL